MIKIGKYAFRVKIGTKMDYNLKKMTKLVPPMIKISIGMGEKVLFSMIINENLCFLMRTNEAKT